MIVQSANAILDQRVKDSEAIIQDLDNIILVIDRYGDTPGSRRLIAGKLSQDLIPRERRLHTSLRALRKLYKRIEKLELGMLVELKGLPSEERKMAKDSIKAKLQKLNVEDRMKAITGKIQDNERLFRSRLSEATREINAGRMNLAKQALLEARKSEEQIRELEDEVQELTTLLRGLTGREIAEGIAQ